MTDQDQVPTPSGGLSQHLPPNLGLGERLVMRAVLNAQTATVVGTYASPAIVVGDRIEPVDMDSVARLLAIGILETHAGGGLRPTALGVELTRAITSARGRRPGPRR